MDKIEKYIVKVKSISTKSINIVTNHRFTILFIILGTAVAFALIRTGSYLDISRDESRYSQETSAINYLQINKDTIKQFEITNQDQDIQVDSNFNPDRNNPFTE